MARRGRQPIIFLLGPSGSGKSPSTWSASAWVRIFGSYVGGRSPEAESLARQALGRRPREAGVN